MWTLNLGIVLKRDWLVFRSIPSDMNKNSSLMKKYIPSASPALTKWPVTAGEHHQQLQLKHTTFEKLTTSHSPKTSVLPSKGFTIRYKHARVISDVETTSVLCEGK